MFFLLLILWPIAELFVAVEVAHAVGVLVMLLLLVLGWPIGGWAIRSQGRLVWRRLALAVSERRPPGREVVDGALVLVGGTLIMIPGFITDVLGLFCILPPTRALIRGSFLRSLQGRMMTSAFRFTGVPVYDAEGTAHDIDKPSLRA